MAHILKAIGNRANAPCRTFECDDTKDLPLIDVTGAPMGSRCYVINAGQWYALNSSGQWKAMPAGGGSDTPVDPSDDIIYDGGEET